MNQNNDREVAKMAAKAIRALEAENRQLQDDNSQQSEKLAALTKERECFTLAKEMADRGQIDRSFESIEKTAAALMDKDLDVVKEAMSLAPSLTSIGEPDTSSTDASGSNAIVEALLGMA
jgi:predicted RNase H-like nuclease (RuvC/YqgF family)